MRIELDDEPLDFSLVHADDAAVDVIGRAAEPDLCRQPVDLLDDDEVLALLLAWRLDVDAEPIGGLIEQDEAVAVVQAARRRRESA